MADILTKAGEVVNPSRGQRNRNPGNIRHTGTFAGELGPDDDGFAIFHTDFWGLRAMFRILRTYIGDDEVTTDYIINRWAPPEDGNHHNEDYVRYIETETETLFWRNPSNLIPLVKCIAWWESHCEMSPEVLTLAQTYADTWLPAGEEGIEHAVRFARTRDDPMPSSLSEVLGVTEQGECWDLAGAWAQGQKETRH